MTASEVGGAHPYCTLAYAESLAHIGTPRFVQAWETFVLQRPISGELMDITGAYPLTMMGNSVDLASGLDDLREAGAVSVVLVSDHLDGTSQSEFRRTFSTAREFKKHFVVDQVDGRYTPTKHHFDRILRAKRRGVTVKWVRLEDVIVEWAALYQELVVRHEITGPAKFSGHAFAMLAGCPGLTVAAASLDGTLVGCHLWICHQGIAWSHLAVVNGLGRKNGASYALYDYSINELKNMVVSLGGGAGLTTTEDDGLALFKEGFSNRKIDSFLYGAVLDPKAYRHLCEQKPLEGNTFFPAYRSVSTEANS
ncbi:MAG: hypothetical protein ABI881_11665 [Betaproteobacteria bacterium]